MTINLVGNEDEIIRLLSQGITIEMKIIDGVLHIKKIFSGKYRVIATMNDLSEGMIQDMSWAAMKKYINNLSIREQVKLEIKKRGGE